MILLKEDAFGCARGKIHRPLRRSELRRIARVCRIVGAKAQANAWPVSPEYPFSLALDVEEGQGFNEYDGAMPYGGVEEALLRVMEIAGYSVSTYSLRGPMGQGSIYWAEATSDDGEEIDQRASVESDCRAHAAAGLVLWLGTRVCAWGRKR